MEKNKKMLVELDGKTKKLLIEEILDETGLSCEILCVYMQTHYVAVVNEINNGKKYLAHFGFLMDDREFVQVGKVEELKNKLLYTEIQMNSMRNEKNLLNA